jgi:hypothetical protein
MEKYIRQIFIQKKSGVTILISNKVDFRAKKITSDKEIHHIVIKESIHQKDIMILST